jgi:hypothetical protein
VIATKGAACAGAATKVDARVATAISEPVSRRFILKDFPKIDDRLVKDIKLKLCRALPLNLVKAETRNRTPIPSQSNDAWAGGSWRENSHTWR